MNRRSFTKSAMLMPFLFSSISSKLSLLSKTNSTLSGFLFPLDINYHVKQTFNDILTRKRSPSIVVSEALNRLIEKGKQQTKNREFNDVVTAYDAHLKLAIEPVQGTKHINGLGYETDPMIAEAINDDDLIASSPLHSVLNVNTFDKQVWYSYCDLASKQAVDDAKRVYVRALDNRPDHMKIPFYVDYDISYLLYEPSYYCYGLPIENPQKFILTDSEIRNIQEKTKKTPQDKVYYKQRFFFNGQNACDTEQQKTTTIWYGMDSVVKEYYALDDVTPCGLPADECNGIIPSSNRPAIRS